MHKVICCDSRKYFSISLVKIQCKKPVDKGVCAFDAITISENRIAIHEHSASDKKTSSLLSNIVSWRLIFIQKKDSLRSIGKESSCYRLSPVFFILRELVNKLRLGQFFTLFSWGFLSPYDITKPCWISFFSIHILFLFKSERRRFDSM